MADAKEYLISNDFLSFIAVIVTGIFLLMFAAFSDGSELFKLITVLVGCFAGFLWLYRFKRECFNWLPSVLYIVGYILANVAIAAFWFETYLSKGTTADAYLSSGYDTTLNHGFISMFGPLIILFLIAKPCLEAAFHDSFKGDSGRLNNRPSNQKKWLLRALLTPGLLLSLHVIISTFTVIAIIEIVQRASIAFIVLGVIMGLIALFAIKHKLVAAKVKRDIALIPDGTIRDIKSLYKDLVKDELTCLSHSVATESQQNERSIFSSKIGGKPYAEALDVWPLLDDKQDAKFYFCLQLMLSSENLPQVWRGRLVTVYLLDWQASVKTYDAASECKFVDLASVTHVFKEHFLTSAPTPFRPQPHEDDDEEAWEEYWQFGGADYALENSRQIKDLLSSYTNLSSRVLGSILFARKNVTSGLSGLIAEGGEPTFIQGEHEPKCDHCGQSMRFLFEFGEILEPELTIGDGAMVYIFGCDSHPHHCIGVVDSC